MAERYKFKVEYEPISKRAEDKNSSNREIEGLKKLACFCLQKNHHNLRGFVYCAMVASKIEANVVSRAEGGVSLCEKACRIILLLPGQSWSKPGEYL